MATAFTSAQKAKIRKYLGWSARFHQADSRLEQALAAIDQEADDATHDLIVADLTQLDAIVTAIESSYGRLKAMQVGSITLPGANEIATLRSEGKRVAGNLARTLGVPNDDVFSSRSHRGFASWSGGGGPDGGGGNQFRQG